MRNIVNATWLFEHLNDPNVRVVDCRFNLSKPNEGLHQYVQDHIAGAVYFALDHDMSSRVSQHGGRHPLPNLTDFRTKLGVAGIDTNTTVVVYDDQYGAFASRMWWLLSYLGHKKVYILDGGYNAWKQVGFPVNDDVPNYSRRNFTGKLQDRFLVTADEVLKAINDPAMTIIDAREPNRYLGNEEPIDPVAGHIPRAINYFWKDSISDEGTWKTVEVLKARFNDIPKDHEIVVYCGSGVTACPTILALQEAGFTQIMLYGGSWSDWISYEDHPIETGENKREL